MTNIIKSIREATQLTQAELAERFNIPIKTIQSWESGIRKPADYIPKMMIRICQLESELALIRREGAEISEHIKNRLYETAFNSVSPDESLLIEDIAERIDFWISEPREGSEK